MKEVGSLLSLFFVLGCAHTNPQDAMIDAIKDARGIYRDSVPASVFSRCKLSSTVPEVLEMPAWMGNDYVAIYQARTQTVLTNEPTPEVLLHEAFHHLTHAMSNNCLSEINSYLAVKVASNY